LDSSAPRQPNHVLAVNNLKPTAHASSMIEKRTKPDGESGTNVIEKEIKEHFFL
jgi:hypothetical protein